MPIFKKNNNGHDNNGGTDRIPGVLILGCPRSGTTLLRRLLDSHPEISCPGETFLFRGCARFLEYDTISGGFPYGVTGALEGLGFEESDIKNRLRDFATSFYEDITCKENKSMWVAKTAVDSFYLPQIEYLFANEEDDFKFICVLRHGMDTVCSLKEFSDDLQSYITELHEYIREYQQPYEAFAYAWADVTTMILDFADKYPDRCHIVKYEELIASPDKKLKEITDFLSCNKHSKKAEEILKNMNVGGIGDWKSFKKTKIEKSSMSRWENDLPASTAGMIAPIINPVLERAGYDTVSEADDEEEKRRKELAMMMMQAKSAE